MTARGTASQGIDTARGGNQSGAGQGTADHGSADQGSDDSRRTARRWPEAALWLGGGLAVFALFLRVSLTARINSDGANSVLQGWDLVHGHLMMHSWLVGDANFYFFELPLNGIVQLVFGFGLTAAHIASAFVYLSIAICAAALAVAGSRGAARAGRCAIVVAVLAIPLLYTPNIWWLLEEPDHPGTIVFILVAFLLAERVPGRWFTAPLIFLILCAGQFSDLTVRYVAIPAIVAVCGYRLLATRRLRSADLAIGLAAVGSVPAEALLSLLFEQLGGMHMAPPVTRLAPVGQWPHHASVTWLNIRALFGQTSSLFLTVTRVGAVLGLIALLAAMAGLARVAWTWRRASRAEQMLALAIVCNAVVYTISAMPLPGGSHELVTVLACGAVLAARALVPARITGQLPATLAVATAALAALAPLAGAATKPVVAPASTPLTSWLEAHGLDYGLSGYWDSSIVALASGGRVAIRAVDFHNSGAAGWTLSAAVWEANTAWYNTSRYRATFAVADVNGRYPATAFEHAFGKPSAIYRVRDWYVLVYRKNLLSQLSTLPWVAARAEHATLSL